MKRLDLIERKLEAIKAKDVNDIVAKQVYLPFIGRAQTVSEVNEWLARRVQILGYAKEHSESEIGEKISGLHKMLSKKGKDALTNELEKPIIPSKEDYETIVAIHLYRFSLGFYG